MYRFIHNETAIIDFFVLLRALESDEAYFTAASVRTKYLTKDEKKELGARDNMFARKLVKNNSMESFLRVIRSYEAADGSYTTVTNNDLPSKALVLYANINPSSGRKARRRFNKAVIELDEKVEAFSDKLIEIADALITGNGDAEKLRKIYYQIGSERAKTKEGYRRLDSEMLSAYQASQGEQTLLDIDFDVPEAGFEFVQKVYDEFKKNNVEVFVIDTKSGYHMLVRRDEINFNYNKIVNQVDKHVKEIFGHAEVVMNKGGLVPIPGTIQGDYNVKFVEMK